MAVQVDDLVAAAWDRRSSAWYRDTLRSATTTSLSLARPIRSTRVGSRITALGWRMMLLWPALALAALAAPAPTPAPTSSPGPRVTPPPPPP